MSDKFLDTVYSARTAEETRDLYDRWSTCYEAEVSENGYVTPARCAQALAQVVPDPSVQILDFGCGTGLSGLALRLEGFTTIDGMDLSPGMIAVAREKDVYRDLTVVSPEADLPRGYDIIAAIGVIGAGAAPLSLLDRLIDALGPGGKALFSFNDHTLEDPSFEFRVSELIDTGTVRLVFREHGPHLPGRNMNATVYISEKS